MNIKDNLQSYCFPVALTADINMLNNSVDELLGKLGISREIFLTDLKSAPVATLNLTHLPGLTGEDRWKKYRGNHLSVINNGVSETDFTELISEAAGTYIERIFIEIADMHQYMYGTKFQGRCQLIASRPTHCYSIHKDYHTNHRYHIPLVTDENFLWLFRDHNKDANLVHMPADGRIWYLNPKDIEHTVMHLGNKPRIHILLTSGI